MQLLISAPILVILVYWESTLGCFDNLCVNFVPGNISKYISFDHDDVIKWKHFPRYWPFVREIHRSPVNFLHKGQWRGALMFSLIYAWINDWVNNREAGDLRRQHGHYDVIVMESQKPNLIFPRMLMVVPRRRLLTWYDFVSVLPQCENHRSVNYVDDSDKLS